MTTTIRFSLDAASRVSHPLSAFMEKLANDPDREEAATLTEVRDALQRRAASAARRGEPPEADDAATMLEELDRLMEEFGKEALAADFVSDKASEGLSRVIQAAVDDVTVPRAPSLRVVREAMLRGLTARLAGEGAIEEDDAGALLDEIDALIGRHGEHAAAESFIRFE